MTQPNWKPSEDQSLLALVNDGLTSSQIASRLGGRSRNGVIMRCHKLGIRLKSGRPQSIVSAAYHGDRSRSGPRRAYSDSAATAVLGLEDDQCRFPVGKAEFKFCCATKVPGRSYCEHHLRVSTQHPELSAGSGRTFTRYRTWNKGKINGEAQQGEGQADAFGQVALRAAPQG